MHGYFYFSGRDTAGFLVVYIRYYIARMACKHNIRHNFHVYFYKSFPFVTVLNIFIVFLDSFCASSVHFTAPDFRA